MDFTLSKKHSMAQTLFRELQRKKRRYAEIDETEGFHLKQLLS